MVQNHVRILLKEKLIHRHVQGRDHLLGIADQLTVQILVKLLDVGRVDVQERSAQRIDLRKKETRELDVP